MRIYNTFTRSKEEFIPISADETRIYSCGPTVYSFAHIGNMRTYIFMDILRRMLTYNKYKIKHVLNITDVGHLVSDEDEGEDKLVAAAKLEKRSPYEVAEHYACAFFKDLSRLNIQKPEIIVKATDHIPEMIEMVESLLAKGYAYEISDGIYFDIKKFGNYGKLSKMDIENQIAGARVCVNEEKRNASDFALWKKAEPNHIMQWDSPWGMGYPGWHIECSAMSRKYLGDTFDIHTGGVDHIPVHHENEIAQTEAYTGSKMADYWMHGEFLLVDGGKMSKSLGNTYTVDTLIEKGYKALDYRYFCLNANYRKKLNFTWEGLKAANISYARMLEGVIEHSNGAGQVDDLFLDETKSEFEAAINDDLNIPLALSSAWKLVRNDVKSWKIYDLLIKMDSIFGLSLDSAEKILDEGRKSEIPSYIVLLVEQRNAAKKKRDFTEADRLRTEIMKNGYEIRDTRDGTVINPVQII